MKIRADICMTFDVPEGTTINAAGMIQLPSGEYLDVDPPGVVKYSATSHRSIAKDGSKVGLHILFKTPRVVSEDYTGGPR